jgi:hypothetical protein
MKKYLLFAFGNFKDESMVTYITDSIADITSSKRLKWKPTDNSIVIHFGSSRDFKRIDDYCRLILHKISTHHFLMEYNDNLSVNLPEQQKDNFLCLDGKYTNKKMEEGKEKESDNKEELGEVGKFILRFLNTDYSKPNEEECLDEIEEEDDILIKKSLKKEYNLDDILDKINKTGVSSLTKEENEYLKNLSK